MHYIFGSSSSQDYDVLVIVDQLQNIATNKTTVNHFEGLLKSQYPNKPLNVNLGVIEGGALTKVFKGTVDEVNNSVIDTYSLHQQEFPLIITKRITRDVDLKVIRTLRVILSLISRTSHRELVKAALKGTAVDKHQVLRSIDFSLIKDLGPGKNMAFVDYTKTLSFQLGQTLALIDGIELYSKEAIALQYPSLEPFLRRVEATNLETLELFKNQLLSKINPLNLKYQTEEIRT